ncbi:DNA/RNA nuclease SfsA [Salaquimonas pukyongi]|uniref:DNA/RNA nuclease SfsA n=1 Tax=Salaquimonas pukyongi TaxID=2712698 RepID=UPI00096B7F65|nr:DNA/RNA nuclease SfsA [Salaquimonas pukyongi]
MKFVDELISCTLIRRYKRFLADVQMPDGSVITVHCPNPGAMLGLDAPGSRAWISDSRNPARKLRHTLEIVEADGTLVGINTNLPNRLAREAMENGLAPLRPGATILAEQKYGENRRIDFLISEEDRPPCFIEVKNVHLVRRRGLHEFPDCKTARGTKHLGELIRQVEAGNRAMMLYIIQRWDGDRFSIASDLDPAYARAFADAKGAGVEMLALKCRITPEEITAVEPVEIVDPVS